jgi:hypothetical protein
MRLELVPSGGSGPARLITSNRRNFKLICGYREFKLELQWLIFLGCNGGKIWHLWTVKC